MGRSSSRLFAGALGAMSAGEQLSGGRHNSAAFFSRGTEAVGEGADRGGGDYRKGGQSWRAPRNWGKGFFWGAPNGFVSILPGNSRRGKRDEGAAAFGMVWITRLASGSMGLPGSPGGLNKTESFTGLTGLPCFFFVCGGFFLALSVHGFREQRGGGGGGGPGDSTLFSGLH